MGSAEVRQFGSLGEARDDHALGRALFDRVCEASIEWVAGQLDSIRRWSEERNWTSPRGAVPGFRFGKYDGLPRDFDAHATQLYLAQFARAGCEFVLILRDSDGVPEREASIREGAQAFLTRFHAKLVVCIGVPSLERESWVLCGFEAKSAHEQQRLDALKVELGFDPTMMPEQLTDRTDQGLKSPKRVLNLLTRDDRDRERDCWLEAPLPRLGDNGARNGLARFLREAADCALDVFER